MINYSTNRRWWETLCYCPKCRKKGKKYYTLSNGLKEICPVCGEKEQRKTIPDEFRITPFRVEILKIIQRNMYTIDDIVNMYEPRKEYNVNLAIKVLIKYDKVELLEDNYLSCIYD